MPSLRMGSLAKGAMPTDIAAAGRSAMWSSLSVAVVYGGVSVAVNFVNKYAVMVLPLPVALMLLKTAATLLLVRVAAAMGLVHLAPPTTSRCKQLMPLTLVYCGHALLVLRSLISLNVPVYNTIKRLAPVMVLATKSFLDRRLPEPAIAGAVAMVVGGCVVAGVGDLSFDLSGYGAAFACAMLQAAYIMLAESANASSKAKAGGGAGGGAGGAAASGGAAAGGGAEKAVSGAGGPGGGGEGASETTPLLGPGDEEGGGAAKSSLQGAPLISRHATRPAAAGSVGSAGGGAGAGGARASSSGGGSSVADAGASAAEVLHYVGLLGTPILAVLFVFSDEPARLMEMLPGAHARVTDSVVSTWRTELYFGVWLAITAAAECALTGTMVLCAAVTGALTTSIVGVLKGVVAVILGFFLLGGVRFHPLNVTGIGMNLAGGVWYSIIKMRSGGGGGGGGAMG